MRSQKLLVQGLVKKLSKRMPKSKQLIPLKPYSESSMPAVSAGAGSPHASTSLSGAAHFSA